MAKITKLAEELVSLTIKEANELATLLEEEHGIKPAAAAVAIAGPAGGDGAAAVEDQPEFDVVRTPLGGHKIAAIQRVPSRPGPGLKEAKEIVDGAPNTIKEAAAKAEAEEIKTKLEATGAEVELK